jgi:hypothetical protein
MKKVIASTTKKRSPENLDVLKFIFRFALLASAHYSTKEISNVIRGFYENIFTGLVSTVLSCIYSRGQAFLI